MPSNPLLENNVQELLYVEVPMEYSAGSGIDITDNVISLDPNVSAAIDNKLDTSSFSSYSATIDDELQYVSANAGKTYSGIAPIVVNNDTNEISADTQDISFGVGLDFTGGVLSVTAQGGDPEVESLVKANSGYWNEVSAVSSTSSVLNNQITAVRNDLNTVSTNTGYLYNDIQTTSGILSAAIDYVSANAGGLTGDYISGSNVSGFELQNHLGEPYNQGYAIYFTTNAQAGMYLSEYDSSSSNQLYLDPEKLMFVENYGTPDQKNETFDANDISALKNTSGNWNDVYSTVSTASGGWGGTSLTGDAQGAVDEVYSNSALWSEITGVSSTYQPIGNYANQTDLEQVSGDLKSDIDYVSANAITSLDGYATTSEVNTVSSYLSGQIDNKLDSTSFNPNDYYPMVGNPSGFISGVDLSDYQTKAGMTAYQPAGDYATTGDLYNTSSILSGAIDYISGNAGTTYTGVAPIVVTGNTISADSFDLNIGSGLAFENDTLYVSAESVPEGVMVESACEYNAVNEISGYNGSAIAQYGAEKQWLQHDDTIVHVSNSAQYAFGVNVSALQRLMGIDETVLFSGNATTTDFPLTLNEPMSSFETIKFYWQTFNYNAKNWTVSEKIPVGGDNYYTLFDGIYNTGTKTWFDVAFAFKEENGKLKYLSGAYTNWNSNTVGDASTFLGMFKIIGIGRKQ